MVGKKSILSLIVGAALNIFVFQNCSDVEFNEQANSNNPFGFGETRVVGIDPNLAENRPPIYLSSIVDNSYSTTKIQNNLINGFTNAVDQLQAFNVIASLHTTTHDQNADKPSSEETDLVSYVDAQGKTVELAASEVAKVPANTNYVEKQVYRLSASWFEGRKELRYQAQKGDFQEFKEAYSRGVSSLGTDGADQEQGVCTLLKKIEQNRGFSDPDNLAFHVYILATNEDDFSSLENCPIEKTRDVTFDSTPKTESCSPGDANCLFDYSVSLNPTTSENNTISYKHYSATVRGTVSGKKIVERYDYSKATASHSLTYQKQVATYTYNVDKTCLKDNIPVPCNNPETKTKTVIGSCGFSSRTCNSSDLSEADSLFNPANGFESCQVSCSTTWQNDSVSSNKIPGSDQLCSFSERSCDGSELEAARSDAGASSTAFIRSCSRKCTSGSSSSSQTKNNQISSCSTASRACTSSEKTDIAAKALGVSSSEVTSCNYTCSEQSISNKNQTLPSSLKSSVYQCQSGDRRTCTQADKDWLESKVGVLAENMTSCQVSCSEGQSSKSFSASSQSISSCPSTQVCTAGQLSLAADHLKASTSDIVPGSCQLSCSVSTSNNGSCQISNNANSNLCSNTAELTSLCSAQEKTDLNLGSCSRGSGERTTTTVKKTVGSQQTIDFADLVGESGATDLPKLVADHLVDVHGQRGFHASFFIHPSNDPNCQAPAELSEGEVYENIEARLGANGSTYPVCLNDYSPALDTIIKIAVENTLNSFNIDLFGKEQIFKIQAILLDDSVVEIPESGYEVFKKTVTFKNKEDLQNVKRLEFFVWNPEG